MDVSSDGSIALLYPPVAGAQEALRPGRILEQTITTFIPEGYNAVVDVVKVIATVQPIDPSVFPQGTIRGAPPPRSRAIQDPLSQFLSGMLRGKKRGAQPVNVKSWITAQESVKIRHPGVRFSGFTVHFDEAREQRDVPINLGASRSACKQEGDSVTGDCFKFIPVSKDHTVWELIQLKATRGQGGETLLSVGQAFDEAYKIQDQVSMTVRVEPLLDVQIPGVLDQRGIDKRSAPSDRQHDKAANDDDQWHLRQISVFDAWKKIRETQGVGEGAEANGILIAHVDTGYRDHPETWKKVGGKRPIDVTRGHDYYDGDGDPVDPLLDDLPLDNPGHGTASGSVIVSPSGCQLADANGCANGIARGGQLVPLRVHRTVSQFNAGNLSRAIHDVAEGNVSGQPRMISIAMGGPPTLSMWKAVKTAEKNGVLVVAAAGNYVRTVVWPARFHSTIAVSANDVRCRPWKHSSRGSKVDISSPGESVWRATLNEQHEYINAMGKGTTFATGNTSGAAALWLAWHRDNPKLKELQQQGLVTETFRRALQASAWQPSADQSKNPPGTHCDTDTWDTDNYGAGILDINALLEAPLGDPATRSLTSVELSDLPLFSSLYPEGTDHEKIRLDYQSLFGEKRTSEPEKLTAFETEILYHYTVNEEIQRTIDLITSGQRGIEPSDRIRHALLTRDLSTRLRKALTQ